MFFTSIKDNCSNALPLFIWSSCFSHIGEDNEAEVDDGKMTLYCPLSVWVAAHPAKKNQHQGLWLLCLLCLGLAHLVWGLKRDGAMSVWSNVFKASDATQVTVYSGSSCWWKGMFSHWHVLKCQRSDNVRVDSTAHRYFNTWKWLLSWALDSKCNFSSAISPQRKRRNGLISNSKLFCYKDLFCTVSRE